MTAMANEMHDSAARTGVAAQGAVETSAEAVAIAQTVAAATEELSTSIHGIGGQVAQSTVWWAARSKPGRRTRPLLRH